MREIKRLVRQLLDILNYGGFMRSIVLAVILSMISTVAWAASARITVTKTNTPTVPATGYRFEEKVNSVWGNLQGMSGPTTIPSSLNTYVVQNLAPGSTHTYRVVPFNTVGDGIPSPEASVTFTVPDEMDTIKITPSP